MAAWVRLEFQHVTVECALFTHVLVWGGKVPRLLSAHSTVVCGVAAVSACYLPLFKPWPIRTHTRHIEYVGQYLCYARTPHIERISCGAALLRVCLECYCGVGRPLNICQTPCTQRPSQESGAHKITVTVGVWCAHKVSCLQVAAHSDANAQAWLQQARKLISKFGIAFACSHRIRRR